MLNPDFRDMLSALQGAEVEYLVVGAFALAPTVCGRPKDLAESHGSRVSPKTKPCREPVGFELLLDRTGTLRPALKFFSR